MFVCCEKNTGKDHDMKICNKSLERFEDFKYLVITQINRKLFHDKIELV
jgi:hypothetical protein